MLLDRVIHILKHLILVCPDDKLKVQLHPTFLYQLDISSESQVVLRGNHRDYAQRSSKDYSDQAQITSSIKNTATLVLEMDPLQISLKVLKKKKILIKTNLLQQYASPNQYLTMNLYQTNCKVIYHIITAVI